MAQIFARDVHTHIDAGAELHPLSLHLSQAALQMALLHLEFGNAIAEQPANAIRALIDGDRVAGAGQLLRSGEPGRTRADHRNGLA